MDILSKHEFNNYLTLFANKPPMGYNALMAWDIIGNSWAAEMLQHQIITGRLRHAYLFSGPPGTGRRTLALKFAQAVNCPTPVQPGEPCGECRVCKQIMRMQHSDLGILQAEMEGGSLKVDQVREIQKALALAPYESPYRVALLLRLEEATEEAQNALLKTLEEPNPHVLILATTDEPENLLPTIISRCEMLRLRPMEPEALAAVMVEVHGWNKDEAHKLAHISAGRPGYAWRLHEDAALLKDRAKWMNDMLKLLKASKRERLAYVERKTRKRERSEVWAELRSGLPHWASLWRDALLAASKTNQSPVNLDYASHSNTLGITTDLDQTARVVAHLERCLRRLPNANLQVMLDTLLLDWPQVDAGEPPNKPADEDAGTEESPILAWPKRQL
jgi:DNA polymerase-3 subunit delta'